jgi:hypothetical protein
MMAIVERRPAMKILILILCAVAVCFGAYAATGTHAGVWTAELGDDHLQLTIFHGNRHGGEVSQNWDDRMGLDVPLTILAGVTRGDMTAEASNVKFTMAREAGTLTFDGRFSAGSGAGHFDFKPSDAFVRNLGTLGFSDFRQDQLLIFTVNDLTIATVRGLQALGYHPSNHELVEIAIFGVTPEVVKEYARLGYTGLSLHDLVELRIGHVDSAFVQGMRDAGFPKLSAHQIAEAGILGVTPAYVREIRGPGINVTSIHEMTNLKIGHVTAKRIDEYKRAGYPSLTARQLSELGIQGVTPAYIEEMRKAGYEKLTVHQLVNAKIFGVTPEYIRKMKAAGFAGVPLEKLVQLKMAGMGDLVTKR